MQEYNFPVNEIFTSIQGEGLCMGSPSIFLRTNHCNLACAFGNSMCDSIYASHPEIWAQKHFKEEPITKTSAGALELIKQEKAKFPNVKHLVVTGGEPTMFMRGLEDLLEHYRDLYPDDVVTIETNGTGKYIYGYVDLISCSPKLSSSCCFTGTDVPEALQRAHVRNRINYESMYGLIKENPGGQLKFVVTNQNDEGEIIGWLAGLVQYIKANHEDNEDRVLEKLKTWPVMVMPAGEDEKQITKNAKMCIDMAIRRGWMYTDRIHLRIWGPVRGV